MAITEIITDGDRIAVNAVNREILLSTDSGASWVDNQAIHIPQRKVDIQVNSSGSITILNERSEYPDKFALPIQINPDPGYVYSFESEGSGELSASGPTSVKYDPSQPFNCAHTDAVIDQLLWLLTSESRLIGPRAANVV